MTFNKHFTQLFEEKVVSSLLVTFKQKLEKRIEESKYTASKSCVKCLFKIHVNSKRF